MDKPRQPSSSAAADRERLDRLEAQTRETADQIQRWARELSDDRLGRIERSNERTAANLEKFETVVRGAITIQQEQISELYRTAIAQQTRMDELRETVNQVIREWQAYLRTIHPPQ